MLIFLPLTCSSWSRRLCSAWLVDDRSVWIAFPSDLEAAEDVNKPLLLFSMVASTVVRGELERRGDKDTVSQQSSRLDSAMAMAHNAVVKNLPPGGDPPNR